MKALPLSTAKSAQGPTWYEGAGGLRNAESGEPEANEIRGKGPRWHADDSGRVQEWETNMKAGGK